jgi:hypothetical protein
MRVDIDYLYPDGFAFRNFLEDHVQALVHCIRANGWSLGRSGRDATIVLGAHVSPVAVEAGTIVLNTERTAPFVHGFLTEYVDRLRPAKAVWSVYDADTEYLRECGVNAFTWRFGPDVFPQVVPPDPDPEADFTFIGSVTPHRKRRMQELEKADVRVAGAFSVPWIEKCHRIGAGRANLVLAYDESAPYMPWQRVVFARALGVPCVADFPATGEWGEQWCLFPRKGDDDWVSFAKSALASPAPLVPFDPTSHVAFRNLIERSLA